MTASRAAPISEGTLIDDKYRVERVLGGGGMGVLVVAHHEKLGRRVALKFLRQDLASDTYAIERFTREARAAVRIRSEHVAHVLDVGTLPTGTPYIVMEYLEGRDLSSELKARGHLTVEEATGYLLQACDAVAHAHALGIVHRDLKPANLFLLTGADGKPLIKVLDFGISKSLGQSITNADLTGNSSLIGSPLYMSPEQVSDPAKVDARTDIWSLGVILHQLLSAKLPFESDSLQGLYTQIVVRAPELEPALHGVPSELVDVVRSCLTRDLEQRMPSVSHLARALAPFAPETTRPLVDRIERILNQGRQAWSFETTVPGGPHPDAGTRSSFGGPLVRKEGRGVGPWIALGVAGLLFGAGALWVAWARSDPETDALDPKSSASEPFPEVPVDVSITPVSSPVPKSVDASEVAGPPAPSSVPLRPRPPPSKSTPRHSPSAEFPHSSHPLDGRK